MVDQVSPQNDAQRKRLQNRQNQAAHRARQKQHISSLETRLGEVQSAYIVAMESMQLAGRRVSEENEFLRKIIKEQLGITDLSSYTGGAPPTSPESEHRASSTPIPSPQATPQLPVYPAVIGSPSNLNLDVPAPITDVSVNLNSPVSTLAPTWAPVCYGSPISNQHDLFEGGLSQSGPLALPVSYSPHLQTELDFNNFNDSVFDNLVLPSSLPESVDSSTTSTLSTVSGTSTPYPCPPNPAPSPIEDLQAPCSNTNPSSYEVNSKLAAAFSLLTNACGNCHANTYGQPGYNGAFENNADPRACPTALSSQPAPVASADKYSWYLGEMSPRAR